MATSGRIIVVHLRRPDRSNPDESRDDPFYEFGSFGLTGCHGSNLLRKPETARGARLAFIQGGPAGTRLVMLTPPVVVRDHGVCREARWRPEWPLRYRDAPLIADRDGESDFPRLREHVSGVHKDTWTSRIASKFRSCCQPVPRDVASEIVRVWTRFMRRGGAAIRATRYWEALPYEPPDRDRRRLETYRGMLADAGAEPACRSRTAATPCRRIPRRRRAGGC